MHKITHGSLNKCSSNDHRRIYTRKKYSLRLQRHSNRVYDWQVLDKLKPREGKYPLEFSSSLLRILLTK